jgi:periplasmic protein TonB
MRWALAGSAALHAALGALLLVRPTGRPADDVPLVEVELVQQAPMQQGAAERQAGRPADPGQEPGAETPQLSAPPAQAARPAPAEVNLGNGSRDLEALSVTGENVVPPAPDALFRNRPPAYPVAAARARAEGTVQLLVRVSASGVPEQVAVASSSGHASLDRAARDAVLLWRFRPARSGGAPVPFDYVMDIYFSLGDR